MIHKVSFKNFFSFKDEQNFSFVVNDQAPQTEKYFLDETNTRLAKITAVFGYNASGKTSALKTISFLQWLIINAYTENPEAKMPIMPFVLSSQKNTSTEMSVDFSIDKNLYRYFVVLTTDKIISEKLQKKGVDKKKFTTLFDRVWDEDKGYKLKDNFGLGSTFKKTRLRKNASILATSIRDEHEESVKIFNFWKNVDTNVTVLGKNDDEVYNTFEAAKFFNTNERMHKKANQLLQKFDIGLKSIDIIKTEENEKNTISFKLQGTHYGEHKLDFALESSGTRKFFALLKNILHVLDTGGVAILDEFDTDLHPMMSEALLEMFFSPIENPLNAQLIFSAHSPQLLNLLDKYNIVFTEKNNKGESELWRLDEVRGVRPDDNYYAKYISGAYGAVGNIDL